MYHAGFRKLGAYKWMHMNIMHYVAQMLQKRIALQCKPIGFQEIRELRVFWFFKRELSTIHISVRLAIVLMCFWAVTLCTYM